MTKSAVITTRLDAETLAMVDKIAVSQGRSRAWFAAQAIKEVAEREAEFLQFVQKGIDDIERGAFYTQEQMEEWFKERVTARKRNIK